ncbi:penicillin acylase family protein [Gammaproteobacteria bacterium]|nr:penicillin acylase family protein [Gammaproteobacteria bacterium]
MNSMKTCACTPTRRITRFTQTGNIAYYHGNFIPRRDLSFDWNSPLDGSDPATEWQGLHTLEESITLLNPENGWIQNTNNWPFTAAGDFSPRAEDYPRYMANYVENPRGIHAVRVLKDKTDFTLDSLIEAAYDPALVAFDPLLPALLALGGDPALTRETREAIAHLEARLNTDIARGLLGRGINARGAPARRGAEQ